jgi:carboxylate-amine ligase
VKGTLGLVNAFGTGVADDRLLQAYVEEMVRFYLGEEPLLESVRTWDLLAPGAINRAVEQLDTIVVKPRTASSNGVVVGPLASAAGLARAADGLRASPSEWVVQDYVPGAQRMRPFVFCCDGTTVAVPGGVTRVDGPVKDVWVI